jgi:VWFA-related protein
MCCGAHGFQVLDEGTVDHASLAAKLSEWMPNSQDLTRAQEDERRNRQETDTVRNQSAPQTVNGTSSQAPNSGTLVDPELRQTDGNPAQDALSILVSVARHLAAIPGHKNLVLVTTDIVLAGWRDKSVTLDKGNNHINEFALHAQEAMNDARVAIYPLDASQPEGDVSADAHSRDIELAQSNNAPTSANIQRGPTTAEVQLALHPIQGLVPEVADATGGSTIRRAGDVAAALYRVVEDGRATYLLSFTPDVPADDKYHVLTVKLPSRRGVTLRYRTGYQYARESSILKERFSHMIWQSFDANEISMNANSIAASTGATLKLYIATTDLALTQKGDKWVDNLNIFLVQRDDDGLHARASGQTLALSLKPDTYQRLLKEWIQLDQHIEKEQNTRSVRVVVVDENSGRMGSITLPTTALIEKH